MLLFRRIGSSSFEPPYGMVRRTIQKFSRQNRLRSSVVLCLLLGVLCVLAYILQTMGIIRHQKLRGRLIDPEEVPLGRHLQDFKPRTAREIRAYNQLQKKMNSNLWQQIIGHQAEKMARLTGNRNLNESAIQLLEEKGQDYYLNLLRNRGQLVKTDDGGSWILSYPKAPIRLPNGLKNKKVEEWSPREKIWLNVTHFPWTSEEVCDQFAVRFSSNRSLPMVGLVSYPSSGNTWLRYLIEGLTGYFSGSMYNDFLIGKKGYCGESVPFDSGLTVVVKSHGHTTGKGSYYNTSRSDQIHLYNHITELNSTAILLIRNPFKAIIGHRHLDEGGHVGIAPDSKFVGEDWDYFVERKIVHWENLYLDWLSESDTSLHVVHYENVRQNLEQSLRQIADFVGLSVDENRLSCVLANPVGHFLRPPRSKIKNPFSSLQKSAIMSAIERVNAALLLAGKESLPLHNYDNIEEI